MKKKLIIVESPGKIKTLSRFLGSEYIIEASKGHVIDLPPTRMGVSADKGFVPDFKVVKDRRDVIIKLQQAAKRASKVYLAPDPDREGEAISWHLANLLDLDPFDNCRISFNSITKDDVIKSLESPGKIDFNLVNAQQSRRILDRLVGYKLSPFLWQKICLGLSAGRVQSVAVSLVCKREREIIAFEPKEYWTISVNVKTKPGKMFVLKLVKVADKKVDLPNHGAAKAIADKIMNSQLRVDKLAKRARKQVPPPPFITSTLQAEASQKHSLTPRRTMSIAQKLYEGIELGNEGHVGLITYMRTDSTRVSDEGLRELSSFINKNFSEKYRLKKPRIYKAKKNSQDAHEAIRPTSVYRTPDLMAAYLKPEQLKLYTLIWKRHVASQMAEAEYLVQTVEATPDDIVLQATGTTMTFEGFTSIYPTADSKAEKDEIPKLSQSEELLLDQVDSKQNFTTPPPRFTESSLIKLLEKEGIGRPSTYAAIVETIQQRKYVKKIEGKLQPSDTAFAVNDILEGQFSDIIDTGFTAAMENALDKIEEGDLDWLEVLRNFYDPFNASLKEAELVVEKLQIETDLKCEVCNSAMLLRVGRSGKFLGCSAYPDCRHTVHIPEEMNIFASSIPKAPLIIAQELQDWQLKNKPEVKPANLKCEVCGSEMLIKDGKYGQFIACSAYPDCKNTKQIVKDTGIDCPKPDCDGKMLEKKSKRQRIFFGCSNYPDCDVTTWKKPTGQLCPECNAPLIWHSTKKLSDHIKCPAKGCGYKFIPEGTSNENED